MCGYLCALVYRENLWCQKAASETQGLGVGILSVFFTSHVDLGKSHNFL